MQKRIILIMACALVCACSSNVSDNVSHSGGSSAPGTVPGAGERPSGREVFFSDSLNARDLYRTYPEPTAAPTPAPKGYRPVYLSSYARHGSRQLIGTGQSGTAREVLAQAAQAGCLTPLGESVYAKVIAIDDAQHISNADLTSAGERQHRGIAERMWRNYPEIFKAKGTPVRLYSTVSQRTMMSMFAQNSRLLELNPSIVSTRKASSSLTQLVRIPEFPHERPLKPATDDFLRKYFDAAPVLARLFTPDMPALKDTASFVRNLYNCGTITCGLDLEDVDFLWDVFTFEELFTVQQGTNYNNYCHNSNSPYIGDHILPEMSPLLKDFIDKADAALAAGTPSADLRFGHDSYLMSFSALIGVGGFVEKEEDPLKVIDVFRDFEVAPMAGNIQMVFFRNKAGDVIVKILQNEVEASLPLDTDIFPYYHWDELRAYFESRISPAHLNPGPDPMAR